MFNCGFHIEDIVKFTGLSLGTIGEYISYDDINSKTDFKKIIKCHPYKNIFDNINL